MAQPPTFAVEIKEENQNNRYQEQEEEEEEVDEDLFQDCEFQVTDVKEEEEVENNIYGKGILENISNLVAMIGGSDNKEESKLEKSPLANEDQYLDLPVEENDDKDNIDLPITSKEDLLAKLHNPNNVKKSFEMKMQTDDEDDEVFIVQDEEEAE